MKEFVSIGIESLCAKRDVEHFFQTQKEFFKEQSIPEEIYSHFQKTEN